MERFLSLLGILRCIYSSSVINSLKDQKLSVFQVKATLSKKHRIRPQTGLILNGISANNGVVRLFSLNSNIQKIFDFFYIIVLLIALLAGKKMQILSEYYFQKKKWGGVDNFPKVFVLVYPLWAAIFLLFLSFPII